MFHVIEILRALHVSDGSRICEKGGPGIQVVKKLVRGGGGGGTPTHFFFQIFFFFRHFTLWGGGTVRLPDRPPPPLPWIRHCMSLHSDSASLIRCKNEALKKKIHFKSFMKCFKEVKNRHVTGFTTLIPPWTACIRINHNKSDSLFNGDIQSKIS